METRELCEKIVNNIFANYLNNASPDFYHTISIVLDGIGHMDITLNRDALLAFTYRLCNIECKRENSSIILLARYYIRKYLPIKELIRFIC